MSISRRDLILYAEDVPLTDIAQQYGTPCYVYSKAKLTQNYLAMDAAFSSIDHQICFAVKANSNIAILNLLAKLGAGFDIVSGGELERVIVAGGDPTKTVFSGLAKTHQDITRALEVNIGCFNIESEAELYRIQQIAQSLNTTARIAFRVNPNVDAKTHPYISTGLKENKFGIPFEDIERMYTIASKMPHINIIGIDCHIGSQLTDTQPFVDALNILKQKIAYLSSIGIQLKHIDIGGGLGVQYQAETPPSMSDYANAILPTLKELGLKVYLEPGRVISANAGCLITKVDILKPTPNKNFAIVDAAMNDLIRPALYQSWMRIENVTPNENSPVDTWDIVGTVCETGDFLGKDRELALDEGDLLAVLDAGAYGFVMSSNYNTRPRVAEVLVDQTNTHLIRQRETTESLWALESIPR